MKQTKIYGDRLLGFHNRNTGDVAINIQLIYEVTGSRYFIKEFSKVMLHEQLHRVIYDLKQHRDKFEFGEEKIIRKLCNMTFTKREREDYK